MRLEFSHLEAWQHDALNTYVAHPKDTTIVVKSQRQIGKSVFIIALLLTVSLSAKGRVSVLVSPVLKQSKRIFKQLCKAVRDAGVIREENKSDLTLEFTNGSEIHCYSIEQGDAIRGDTVTGVLCIDEAAFCQSEAVYDIMPMTNVSRANIVLTSTPKFSHGVFYDLYMRGLQGGSGISLDWTKYDTSKYLTDERKAFYKSIFPALQYQCEIEGKFIDAQSVVFGDFLQCIKDVPYNGEAVTCGIDWATGTDNDSTVLTFIGEQSRTVYGFDAFNDLNAVQTIERVCADIARYNTRHVVVEGNSIGQVYYDLLTAHIRQRNIPVAKFTTTNDSKRQIIEGLAVGFQNRSLTLPPDEVAKHQLSMYEIEATATGKITYNGGQNCHDDYVMSLAIAYNAIQTTTYAIR